jgi:hypothetical protein
MMSICLEGQKDCECRNQHPSLYHPAQTCLDRDNAGAAQPISVKGGDILREAYDQVVQRLEEDAIVGDAGQGSGNGARLWSRRVGWWLEIGRRCGESTH